MHNLPNILSISRIGILPFFFYFLLQGEKEGYWISLGLFFLASITDFLDGYLARKLQVDSPLGRFLDPLADKILVWGAMMAFYWIDPSLPYWMLGVIIGRDLFITFLRYIGLRRGKELKTSYFAKTKTFVQMTGIGIILFIFSLELPYRFFILYYLLLVITVFTLLSGVSYLIKNYHLLLPEKS